MANQPAVSLLDVINYIPFMSVQRKVAGKRLILKVKQTEKITGDFGRIM